MVDGLEFIGKGQGYLEIALEEAEQGRSGLLDETLKLRSLALTAVNEAQSLLHQAKGLLAESARDSEVGLPCFAH